MTLMDIVSIILCREHVENVESYRIFHAFPAGFVATVTGNIFFTLMTYFPLQFYRLDLTSTPQSASPVRSSPPLEKAIAPRL